MDWSEVELEGPEDSDHSNSFQTINDDIDIEIKRISVQNLNLTLCVVVDII